MVEIFDDDILTIYSTDDKRLDILGTILSNKTSRKLLVAFSKQELNATSASRIVFEGENPKLANLDYHIKRMLEIGLLTCEKKLQRKKGHVLKYYVGPKFILITPPEHLIKAQKSKTLKNIFRKTFKIGLASISTFYLSSLAFHQNLINGTSNTHSGKMPISDNSSFTLILELIQNEYFISSFAAVCVVIFGIVYYFKKRK